MVCCSGSCIRNFIPPGTSSSGAAVFHWRAVGFWFNACVGTYFSRRGCSRFEIFLGFFERHDVRVFVMEIKKIGILSERTSAKRSCVGLMTVDATGTLIQFYQLAGLLRAPS
jgi:hypothetical protein